LKEKVRVNKRKEFKILGVPLALLAAGRAEPPFPPIRRDTTSLPSY